MFELNKHEAKLVDAAIEVKAVDDGDDKRALDLDFLLEGGNSILDTLSPDLKTAYFRKPNDSESPQESLIDGDNNLVVYKFLPIKTFTKWDYTSDGYGLTIMNTLNSEKAYETFEDCRLSGIQFLCNDGGHSKIKFRVRIYPTSKQVGRIFDVVKQEKPLILTPPEADPDSDQLDLDD